MKILSLADISCNEDIEESGSTLVENSRIKARYVKEHYGYDCFADDTGLEVEALGGAPGVHSARYATDGHDSEANIDLLLRNLENVYQRRARFRTVITLIEGDQEQCFEGVVNGEIIRERRGSGGFGYDAVFQPEGWSKTFGEATAEEKNAVSHRGRAVQSLMEYLSKK